VRADLEDAYAAADWAITHLEGFDQRLNAWIESKPYSLIEEPHPEIGKKLIKLHVENPLTATFNAEVGAIINTIRTSLDLLASALARRNGKMPSADRHFPLYPTLYDFIDPINVAKRKKWLSDRERKIIEELKPYRGGNDRLFALHHFDVIRKHERLINIRVTPLRFNMQLIYLLQGMRPVRWPGFDDDAVIATTRIEAADSQLQLTFEVRFGEGDLIPNEPVRQVLRDFWRLASMIIEKFE
jgi:hypothetical protein